MQQTCNVQRATCNVQRATCNVQRATCNVQRATYVHRTNSYVQFGNPYSPHQLGTYPIADSPTVAQEPMPLENTGNMFFMMLGIVREQGDS